jgi:hypothetical protein
MNKRMPLLKVKIVSSLKATDVAGRMPILEIIKKLRQPIEARTQ